MREAAFVKRNVKKWEEFEDLLNSEGSRDPDKLSELFIKVTDDLSFARTQYPQSKTHQYLNSLASKVHLKIYRNKAEDKKRFKNFWKYEVPTLFYNAQRHLFYSFLIFVVAIAIGVISQNVDQTFARSILSDDYVNMTLENIENGDPLGVYSRDAELDMFFQITFNNVVVSFTVFAFGLLLSFGTGFALFRNGIMVGTFFTFLAQEGFLQKSLLVVMLHGTLELSAIVIAGAAGLVMGNSILFPGTYSRMASFLRGAKLGLKIIVGLIPVFILAGLIESFVTRYTNMPVIINILVILASAAFIIYYYIIYPRKLNNAKKDIRTA